MPPRPLGGHLCVRRARPEMTRREAPEGVAPSDDDGGEPCRGSGWGGLVARIGVLQSGRRPVGTPTGGQVRRNRPSRDAGHRDGMRCAAREGTWSADHRGADEQPHRGPHDMGGERPGHGRGATGQPAGHGDGQGEGRSNGHQRQEAGTGKRGTDGQQGIHWCGSGCTDGTDRSGGGPPERCRRGRESRGYQQAGQGAARRQPGARTGAGGQGRSFPTFACVCICIVHLAVAQQGQGCLWISAGRVPAVR